MNNGVNTKAGRSAALDLREAHRWFCAGSKRSIRAASKRTMNRERRRMDRIACKETY